MKAKRFNQFLTALAVIMILSMLLSACTPATKTNPESDPTAPKQEQSTGKARMTEQGTPRNETLIVDALDGRITNPKQFNPYIPGTAYSEGFHQVCMANLYEIDGTKGDMIPIIAAKPAEALNADFTKWKITLRSGLAWSDGQEFSAEDVAWTLTMLSTNKDLPAYGFWNPLIKSAKATDKVTVEIEMNKPYPRIETLVGDQIFDSPFHVLAKHIWSKENPATFAAATPTCIGPYKLKDVDANGMWTLWEKRADWQKAAYGASMGEPKPKYILFKFYGPEEKRVLAGAAHDLDVFMDITPDSWDVLRKKNEYAKAWFDQFPYANMDDPCERGISFNTSKAPFDKLEVRWALALATDIQSVSMATFGGKMRFSPIQVPPLSGLQPLYHFALEDWLKNLQLADGYKPFDGEHSAKLVKSLAGEKGLPTDPKAQKELFGVGWWKHDPNQAAKLLQSVGFKKGSDGKWLTPDGKPWKITINAPANFEVQSGRLAFAVADSWKKFGIDATAQAMEGGPFWTAEGNGDFEAGSYWPGCGVQPDVYNQVQGWHKKYVVPTGQTAPGNRQRYKSDRISNLIDQLSPLKPTDPKIVPLVNELNKAFVEEMPWIPMFGTSKFVPTDTYYWTGFPNSKDPYFGPWWWWSNFPFILHKLQPTGKM